ncbi:MAG: hypothetical protein HY047_17510 [Acidobacteria bacterium]|nr:hypothetical protein [Acidobacteriota bacterium]
MIHSRLADWVLACAVAPADREAAVGDLAEEYAIRVRGGSALRASCWYWGQVVRSAPWLIWTAVRRGGWFGTLCVALAACVCQAGVELGIRAAITRLPPADGNSRWLVASAIVLASLVVVSFASGRIRPGASSVFTAVALIAVVLQLFLRNGAGLSIGRQLVAIVAGPSAACLGGLLSWRVRPPADGIKTSHRGAVSSAP